MDMVVNNLVVRPKRSSKDCKLQTCGWAVGSDKAKKDRGSIKQDQGHEGPCLAAGIVCR